MRVTQALGTVLLTVVSVTAQNHYVPDNDAGTGPCNVLPFGYIAASPYSQCRYQCKVAAADLGSVAGSITGLGFAACNDGISSFSSIEIRIDHHGAGAALDPTFDNNLTAGAATVLFAASYVWHTSAHQWNEVGLQELFAYNGIDDIVIDITVTDAESTGGFHRGSGQRLRWYDAIGTAPAVGTLDNSAAKLEVSVLTAKTSLHGLGCAGTNGVPSHTTSGMSQLNSQVAFDATNLVPSGIASCVFGLDNSAPTYPVDLTGLGMAGCLQYFGQVSNVLVAADPAGNATLSWLVPNSPMILGLPLYTQYAALDPGANTLGGTTSNYARLLIGN